ncbi:hypothetical protein BS78_K287800 [Paspalum vaginatum]|uniref:Glycosyltransferase n=1 Tax=Paspalum vaginatum TaxID=158149 RepID=A0A9W8CG34_9POAL|nr:hypothetical protein BS78_K287800 [Paspalum vaginatum]
MDASSPPPPPLRVVIVPWLAFGHLLPYLELAERLASRGHRVTYASTPRNLARLPPRRNHAGVSLAPIPLPRARGLPDGAESTNDVTGDARARAALWEAFDGAKPDWVIADTFHHWAPAAARALGVPCAMLQGTAAFVAAMGYGARGRAEIAAPSVYEQPTVVAAAGERAVGMQRYEWEDDKALFAASGMSVARRISLTLEGCAVAAVRSCPEWEPEAFPLAAALLGKPLVPLGLVPPSSDGGRGADANREDAAMRWLDTQPPGSVLYVALGSEVPLRVELVREPARGLELAGTRFLWALRKPRGILDSDGDDGILPPGFEERTRGRGLVATGWVPQFAVLEHGAVGGFLTHCGRNSLIEGLLYGHPLVMLPIFADQGPKARLMEKRKVGLQVARDEDDGSFDRHGIASAVRAVMVEEDTRTVFVANAKKVDPSY